MEETQNTLLKNLFFLLIFDRWENLISCWCQIPSKNLMFATWNPDFCNTVLTLIIQIPLHFTILIPLPFPWISTIHLLPGVVPKTAGSVANNADPYRILHCSRLLSECFKYLYTVDSRYLEFQGTLWNISRYPYLRHIRFAELRKN